MFEITRTPIDLGRVVAAVTRPGAGAIVTFLGTTRDHNAGRRVVTLEYEAYPEMAVREMQAIAAEAQQRFGIQAMAIVHRVGTVEIGEASVAIAVSAAHRDAAYAASRFAIDRLKEIVPIWKKERYEGGEVWIGPQQGGPVPCDASPHSRQGA
jgi:molybdopterin synthase catalytic subunit